MTPICPDRPAMTLDWPDAAVEEMADLLAKGHSFKLYQFAFEAEPLSTLVTFAGSDKAILFRSGWRNDRWCEVSLSHARFVWWAASPRSSRAMR